MDERDRLYQLTQHIFLDNPGDTLVAALATRLGEVKQIKALFGTTIEPYLRQDYAVRNLPALRIYNERGTKEFESWFIDGDITLDVVLPPSIRRPDTQAFPDQICAALISQFRRPSFFDLLCGDVPGLNKLGQRVTYDKSLALKLDENGTLAPLIQIVVNFRVDLRQWDRYLESQERTLDDPFEKSLGVLETIALTLQETTEFDLGD